MSNHFHLVLETPPANLAVGMQWLLGTYMLRFNRQHRLSGISFKALGDEREEGYLRAPCDYVHLNPVRRSCSSEEKLGSFRWSSYPGYRQPKLRPGWLRVGSAAGGAGLQEDSAATRREFARRLALTRWEPESDHAKRSRRRWRLGAEDFADWLAENKLPKIRIRGQLLESCKLPNQEFPERPEGRGDLPVLLFARRQDRPFYSREVAHLLRRLRIRGPRWMPTGCSGANQVCRSPAPGSFPPA